LRYSSWPPSLRIWYDQHSNAVSRKDIKGVIESLADVVYKELKKTGAFFVPGLAKFVVIKKPATKARKGINPFTKEPTIFKAKPARKVIRARPVKAVKEGVLILSLNNPSSPC
jgi:DNA-binding protein HU-beta